MEKKITFKGKPYITKLGTGCKDCALLPTNCNMICLEDAYQWGAGGVEIIIIKYSLHKVLNNL